MIVKERLIDRKMVAVPIAFELLRDFITTGYEIIGTLRVKAGIPKDAQFCGSRFDEQKMIAYLIFTHPSFAVVPFGSLMPEIEVIVEREQ